MNNSIWKKSANIFVCGLLGAAILVAGCGDNKTSAAVKEKPAATTEQQLSSARNTPIVAAAKKVGPAVVSRTRLMCVTFLTARSLWSAVQAAV